jgi:lysyl-tRNA synthetase class 1
MDEIDELEEIFFKKKKIKDKKEFAKLNGLYLYSWLLKPPKQLGIHIPYNLLVYLARVAPEKERKKFVIDKLIAYGYFTDSVDKEIDKKIDYAINWAKDFGKTEEVKVSLKNAEKDAISDLIDIMEVEDDEEKIQSNIFAIARKNDLSARDFFRTLYLLLLGTQAGPKLGSYIKAMGKESVIISLKKALKKSS